MMVSVTATSTSRWKRPHTFNWGSGNTSNNSNSGLATGNYTVTITDSAGCSQAIPYFINQDAPFNLTSIVTPISCNGLF